MVIKKKKPSPKFKKELLNEDLQAVNESVCIHRTLIRAFRDYFVLSTKTLKRQATGRKLEGGKRLPRSSAIRKFPALITKAQWRGQQQE